MNNAAYPENQNGAFPVRDSSVCLILMLSRQSHMEKTEFVFRSGQLYFIILVFEDIGYEALL